MTDPGTRSSSAFIEELTGPDDTVIVNPFIWFSYAAEPEIDVVIKRDEKQLMGFFRYPAQPRIWVQYRDETWDKSVAEMRERVKGSAVVVLHDFAQSFEGDGVGLVSEVLDELGFVETTREIFGPVIVVAFERVEVTSSIN